VSAIDLAVAQVAWVLRRGSSRTAFLQGAQFCAV